MKKTIKSVLFIGTVAFQMTHSSSIGFLEKLSTFFDSTGTTNPFKFFMMIANQINKKQNNELGIKLEKTNSSTLNEQFDRAIEYSVPHMEAKQKLNLCRLINYYRKNYKNENLFSPEFKNAKIVDIQINEKNEKYDLIIVENDNKKYEISLNKFFYEDVDSKFLKFSATDQLLYTLFENNIDKMDKLIDCKKCYVDFITEK